MFEPDTKRHFIDVKPDQVITLLNSTIRPHIAMAGKPSEPTDAYACTFKQGNLYETLVFFHLTKTHEGVLYKWNEGPQSRDKAKNVEREALKFLEAMGFQMDSLHFRKKSPEEQKQLVETLSCFRPDLSHLKAAQAAEEAEVEEVVAEEMGDDEQVAGIDEVMVESIKEEGEAVAETVEEAVDEAPVEMGEAEEVELESDMFEEVFDQESTAEAAPPATPVAEEAPPALDLDVEPQALPVEAEPVEEAFPVEEAAPEAISMELEAGEVTGPVDEAFESAFEAEPVAEAEPSPAVEVAAEPDADAFMDAEPAAEAVEEEIAQVAEAEAGPAPPLIVAPPPPPIPSPPPQTQPAPIPVAVPATAAGEEKIADDLEPLARFIASM